MSFAGKGFIVSHQLALIMKFLHAITQHLRAIIYCAEICDGDVSRCLRARGIQFTVLPKFQINKSHRSLVPVLIASQFNFCPFFPAVSHKNPGSLSSEGLWGRPRAGTKIYWKILIYIERWIIFLLKCVCGVVRDAMMYFWICDMPIYSKQ